MGVKTLVGDRVPPRVVAFVDVAFGQEFPLWDVKFETYNLTILFTGLTQTSSTVFLCFAEVVRMKQVLLMSAFRASPYKSPDKVYTQEEYQNSSTHAKSLS